MKKLHKELKEEGKLRIHIAQGIPRTTDEPEVNGINLVKLSFPFYSKKLNPFFFIHSFLCHHGYLMSNSFP